MNALPVVSRRAHSLFIALVISVLLTLCVGQPPAFASSAEPLEAAPSPAEMTAQATGDIASGFWGTCKWEISSKGVLRIHPGMAGDVYSATWRNWATSITAISAPVENGKKIVCSGSMDYLFCALPKLQAADLSGFNTSKATSMRSVFNSCDALVTLNIKGWTTAQVTDMADMFGGCEKLKSLNLKAFNTKNVTQMQGMFTSCKALTTLDLSSFDARRVTDVRSMFAGCASLKTLNLTRFSTASVSRSDNMFAGCNKLNKVTVGSSYKILDKSMIPAATSRTGMWWSTKAKTWLTESGIVSKRSKKADTYLASGKDVGKVSLQLVEISLSQRTFTYTGSKRMPQVTVLSNGKALKLGTDYTLTFLRCRNAGTALVQVKGKGLFTGERTVSYKITAADLSNVSFAPVKDVTYSGKANTPKLSATYNDMKLGSKDYGVSYKNNVKAGKASIIVTGRGNYKGKKTITFKIKPANIGKAKVSKIKARTFTGKNIEPSFKVTLNGKVVSALDYSAVYVNNVNAGTATVTIKGKRNFKGTNKAKFQIQRASISGAKIEKIPEQASTGKAVTPSPKITWKGMTLHAGSDYSLSYKSNKKPGTAKLIATGAGNFKGKVSTTFKIGKAANPMVVKTADKSVAYNELLSASKTFNPLTVAKAAGAVSYTVLSKSAPLSFNTKTGALTVASRTYPGVYQMKVKVTAAGTKKYGAMSVTVTLKVTVRGTLRTDEREDNNDQSKANYLRVGADMYGKISSQSDNDWFYVQVETAGNYKLELTLDDYVEMYGGHISADLYESASQLTSPKKYAMVYVANDSKSSSTSAYLPKGISYVCVHGGVAWPGTFSYHFRLARA